MNKQQNCQGLLGNLKVLVSWRMSMEDQTEGLCCGLEQGWTEWAEGGEFGTCSVVLLRLHQMFSPHTHSGGTIIDYTFPSGIDSHQCP